MNKEWLVKILALGIVVLFIVVTTTPIIGISIYLDDTTPPITTISFNPPEPDGENGWYVSNVTVTLNATDDDSGVNITKYRINGGIWYNYTEPFILVDDGEDIFIEFYSVDNAGNEEAVKSAVINIDKTKPWISLTYEVIGGNQFEGWDVCFTATATDDMSNMHRVEFYVNKELKETVNGSGPTYEWLCYHNFALFVRGIIRNLEINDEYVKFFAILVIISSKVNLYSNICAYAYDIAGNYEFDKIENPSSVLVVHPGIYLFKNLILSNYYYGFIGKFFIRALFINME